MKKILATAALAALLPLAANAATMLNAGQLVLDGAQVSPGFSSVSFDFEVNEPLRIRQVSFTINGFSAADVEAIHFGLDVANNAATATGGPLVFAGEKVVNYNASFAAGDMFSIVFDESAMLGEIADVDFAFRTTEVPIPAAGLLLATALVGGGFAARRKKTS
jgi:opacity protein-like surface antigen